MKILVTGGTGFIGSHVVEALQAAGHEPMVLCRTEPDWSRTGRPICHPPSSAVPNPTAPTASPRHRNPLPCPRKAASPRVCR